MIAKYGYLWTLDSSLFQWDLYLQIMLKAKTYMALDWTDSWNNLFLTMAANNIQQQLIAKLPKPFDL